MGTGESFLGRSGQALFASDEARLQVYVDDPWSIWRGSPAARARNKAILLLWWLVLGPPISWRKVQQGWLVKWIGVEVALKGGGVELTLDSDFIDDLLAQVQAHLQAKVIPAAELRKLAGKAE